MIYSVTTKKALGIAADALRNKLDNGIPIFADWLITAERMPDENCTAVALLYGAISDGGLDQSCLQEFPDDVAYAVDLLLPKDPDDTEFLQRIRSCPISWTVMSIAIRQKAKSRRSGNTLLGNQNFEYYLDLWCDLEEMFVVPPFPCPDVEERLLFNRRYADRIHGCLLGSAVADSISYGRGGTLSSHSQTALSTATGLLSAATHVSTQGFNTTEIGQIFYAYQDWCHCQLEKKVTGSTTWLTNIPFFCASRDPDPEVLSLLASSKFSTMQSPVGNNNSASCLTRVAPIALIYKNGDNVRFQMKLAAEAAALTHGHPMAWLTCAMLVCWLNRILYSGTYNLFVVLKESKKLLFQQFGDSAEQRSLFEHIDEAILLAANDASDESNMASLGQREDACSSLAIALYCVIRHPMDFEAAILAANRSGNRAAACVTGQLLGAKLGMAGIPPQLLRTLEGIQVIREISDDLTNGCQIRRHSSYDDPKWRSKYLTCDYTM